MLVNFPDQSIMQLRLLLRHALNLSHLAQEFKEPLPPIPLRMPAPLVRARVNQRLQRRELGGAEEDLLADVARGAEGAEAGQAVQAETHGFVLLLTRVPKCGGGERA